MSKNFEQAYKELAQNEMPDLWDRIEAGLKDKSAPVGKTMQESRNAGSMTEKENTLQKSIVRQNMAKQSAEEEEQKAEETKKEKTQPPVKSGTHPAIKILQRYSTLAAAAVCAAVVIPAVLLLGRNMGDSNMAETGVDSAAAGAVMEESMEAAVEEIAEESVESAVEEAMPEEGMEADAETGRGFNAAVREIAGGSSDAAAESTAGESFDVAEKEDAAEGSGAAAGGIAQEMAAGAVGKNADEGGGDLGSEKKQQSVKEEEEPVQGTAFNHVMIEVKDILCGKNVQDGTWYTVTVKEDPSGYLEAEEQITVFVPVYSSLALIEGKTFEVDLVYEKGDGYSFVLAGYHGKAER